MKFYQDIIIVSGEVSKYYVLSKIYSKLHSYFSNTKDLLAVSFPEYENEDLGNKIRIFGDTEESLNKLALNSILKKYKNYIRIRGVQDIPKNVDKYAVFSRIHLENSNDNKARRYAKRHSDTDLSTAEKIFSRQKRVFTKLPYIQLISSSNSNSYRLVIGKREVLKEEYDEKFSKKEATKNSSGTFGLNPGICLPDF